MILCEEANGKEDGLRFLEKINDLRKEFSQSNTQEDAPEIPKRNDQPLASVPLNQHFTDGSEEQSISSALSFIGETSDYDSRPVLTERRPTVGFQEETTQLEDDGTITFGSVNNARLRNRSFNGPRVLSLTDETDDGTDSTRI